MTTRRTVLRLAGALPAAALLTACRPNGTEPAAATSPETGPYDALSVRLPAGPALIDARGGRVRLASHAGVIATDRSALAWGEPTALGTSLQVRGYPGNDGADFQLGIKGRFAPRAIGQGGRWVALASGSASGSAPYRPDGRSETTIVIAAHDGEKHRLTLPGCIEPEAFSLEGDRLFVLDYQPPTQPDRYRVRMIDLATGTFGPILTRDKVPVPPGAEEEMRGEGRQAVYGPGYSYLFTLYTHQPDHEHTRDLIAARPGKPEVHAFVHSLNTQIGFAYCIDLPAPFGHGPASAHAIALARQGEDPFVVDASTGTVARLNGEELAVREIGSFPASSAAGSAAGSSAGSTAAVATAGQLFVGTGAAVQVINTSTLKLSATWSLPAPVRGLALSEDEHRLWVGQPDTAVALDPRTGAEVARIPVKDLLAILPA